ncbi:unnamed protein product [Closterium sp. NIES-64]|nr:unnamed protein product [Closterium sp. NIES-64]
MAEAVAVLRAKKQAEKEENAGEASFPRSKSLLDDNFDAYQAANYRMWVRSKSDDTSSRKKTGSSTLKTHNLDFLDSRGIFTPHNPELLSRLASSSSVNPSIPVDEGGGGEGYGGDEDYAGICAESGAEGLAEEGRAGGEGSGAEGARDSSGNSSSGNSSSGRSHESAADDDRGLRAFLRHCGPRVRRARNTSADCTSGTDGAEGGEGGEGKATAAGGLLKRSMTEDTTGETMARSSGSLKGLGAGDSLARSSSDVLRDAEMDEMDREVLQEAFVRVVGLQQRVQHYRDLGGFVVLMALFITILYLQADSSRSYEITSAHAVLFPPVCASPRHLPPCSSPPYAPPHPPPSSSRLALFSRLSPLTLRPACVSPCPPREQGMRQDASNTFNSPDDFYNWLNTSIIQPTHAASQLSLPLFASKLARSSLPPPLSPPPLQSLWADPTCGTGLCERPFQYPAFGRFGCEADCGIFPNLTSVVIRLSSQLDTQQAADESSWNLCMVNPVSLCWYARPPPASPCSSFRPRPVYEEFQPFPVGDTEVSVALDIPDGDWVVVLNAPAGGIRGTVHAPPPGTRRFSVVGATTTLELAAWGYCEHDDDVDAANQALPSGGAGGSPPDVCRDTCARLVLCLPATCGRPFTEREVAGAFVDCARMCIVAPSSVTSYADTPCPMPEIASLFSNVPCNVSVQGASGAAVAALPPQTPASSLTAAAAAAAAAMAAAGTAATPDPAQPSLWSLLGATDRQRLTALQVAVSRALFTMAKDRCLAGRAPGAEARLVAGASNHTKRGLGSVRWRIVACLCTMLGGPVTTLEECRFTDERGQQVVEGGEMHAYLLRTHVSGGRVISAQHMRRFVQTMVAALRSVTAIPDEAAARLNTVLHAFDDAVVTSDSVGCSQGGAWLQWRAGMSHNTTIHVGDKVTWVWDDDLPHSIRVSGMGEAGDPLFLGFGGNRLAVSRQMACTPMNVGAGDMRDDPVPCVLSECKCKCHEMDDEPAGTFAYSKVFAQPITIHYEDGTVPGTVGDSQSSSASPSSSTTLTSMASSILTVLPARTGADATAGFVNTTTIVTNATNPTASNSTTARPTNTNTAATYECSPRCRLRRLANGVCDAACNTPACAFDGGDCACVDPLFGPGICPCPPGHTRRDDGSCCLSTAVGANLNFPFSLQRYGPNYTESNYVFAAERGFAATRYVSRRNRVLIGMVLQQERWVTQQCSEPGLLHLAGWCSNGTSTEPFGVNPHFLPTSAIYDSAASANMSQLDNNTFGFRLQFNPQGLPYGFIYPLASLTTYPLVFGINLDNEAATRRLTYLVDGSYIDNGTRSVEVNFITFNGETLTFVLTTVRCTVNGGGSMAVSFKSQPAAMAMYDASADNIARLVLEVVYLVGLLWNVCGELQEMADRAATHGSVLSYFEQAWNWIDMLSLSLQAIAVVLWVVLWRYVSTFDMQPRYNIYYSLFETPRYWAVPNPPTGFISAIQAFADLRNIINLRAVYFALQGINVFFMMIRLLKVMDFQPYLGVITRSLSLATPSLLHFFLLSFTVFFCFSMYGYLVFGGAMELFSTVLNSMFSLFLLLINDNGSAYFLQRLESWDLIAAMLFFFMFIVFMVFILLNFLIAIIVDAFMSVKDSDVVATSIAADLAHIFKYKWNCWRGRYLPYQVILDRLMDLGAKDTRIKEDNPRMRRFKSIQWRVGLMLSGARGSAHKAAHFARSDNQPAFPSAVSESRVRKQHVLTVREKRIDAISLAMILQRRHDERARRARQSSSSKAAPRFSSPRCENGSMCGPATWALDEERLEQLSQAVVLQCGEVVKQAALPVKKPVQKLSLNHVQEEVVRCQAGVEELRGMMADMQSDMRAMMALLDRALPSLRAQGPLIPRSLSPLPGQLPLVQLPLVQLPLVQQPLVQQPLVQQPLVQQPLVQPCLKVRQLEEEGEGLGEEAGGMGVGEGASGNGRVVGSSRSPSSKRGPGRRVVFQDEAVEGGEGGVGTDESCQQPLIGKPRDP